MKRRLVHWLFIVLCAVIIIIAVALIASSSPYLGWNYSDPETAVVGATYHAFEWLFFRIAAIILVGGIVGIILTGKKNL